MSAPLLSLALTGNIASGKSTVAAQLAAHGATLIDADMLAREAVAPGTPGLAAVVEHFGDGVLAADRTLNRQALRDIVFRDPAARTALNAIVHPEVGRLRAKRLDEARSRGDRIVISDIPLLFEVGLEDQFDGVIFVDAPEAVREARLIRDRGLSAADARALIAAQWPAARKRDQARWVIENAGTRADLTRQVDALWQALAALAPLP